MQHILKLLLFISSITYLYKTNNIQEHQFCQRFRLNCHLNWAAAVFVSSATFCFFTSLSCCNRDNQYVNRHLEYQSIMQWHLITIALAANDSKNTNISRIFNLKVSINTTKDFNQLWLTTIQRPVNEPLPWGVSCAPSSVLQWTAVSPARFSSSTPHTACPSPQMLPANNKR